MSARYSRFRAYVESAVRTNQVAGIAEEAIHEEGDGRSIAMLVAEGLQPPLPYIPCEPGHEQRAAMGIPTDTQILQNRPLELLGRDLAAYRDAELRRYFRLREKYWLERIQKARLRSVLLVCGANHVPTFTCYLAENGISSRIVIADWCASDECGHGPIPLKERPI